MRQSKSYWKRRGSAVELDSNALETYKIGVALRIQKRTHGRIRGTDALQLAIIPAFFLWLFRKPRAFFKRRKIDRKIRHKLSGTNSGLSGNK